ncbi:MAG: D-aminoacylase [Rhodospirillales bacterium]|jgi:N-acyl-D-amino-acid deacylase|nr:D-aminoacylase [Rhodospirillales bacterium]
MNECELIIEGGEVIDGAGGPRFSADVAVTGGRIVATGDLSDWQAAERIDATGLIVAPGFIDAHTHDDRLLFSDPSMAPKASQGVTTVVVGNCGVSLAPYVPAGDPPPPLNLLGGHDDFCYSTVSAYAEALEKSPAAINAAVLAGHTTFRAAVMDDLTRAATPDEIEAMAALLDEALAAGCVGLSTGTAYPAAAAAPTEELLALAERLGPANAVFTTHMRNEADDVIPALEETLDIARRAGVHVVISHHKVCGKENFGRSRETLAAIEAARAEGLQVDLDTYPYAAGSTVLLKGLAERSKRVLITWCEPHPEMGGRDLADIMAEWDIDLDEAIERLNPAGAVYFQADEGDVQRILSYSHTMIGSDGLPHDARPHPRLWGAFARVLGHYSRDLGLFSLEEAVHRMTGIPARVFGLEGRGTIAEGAAADVVVFDAASVIDRSTYEESVQQAAGIALVLVNGQVVWRDGEATGNRPGQFIKRKN